MPNVQTTTWIDAPIATVYEIAKNNQEFPEFMDDVLSLTIVEQEGGRIVSDWVGVVSAFARKVRWTQEDLWDDEARTCHFKQLKGDYDELSGVWTFSEENGGTRFDSSVDYEYKVPGLGQLVNKVVHNLVVKNLEGVLQAIKERAEARSA